MCPNGKKFSRSAACVVWGKKIIWLHSETELWSSSRFLNTTKVVVLIGPIASTKQHFYTLKAMLSKQKYTVTSNERKLSQSSRVTAHSRVVPNELMISSEYTCNFQTDNKLCTSVSNGFGSLLSAPTMANCTKKYSGGLKDTPLTAKMCCVWKSETPEVSSERKSSEAPEAKMRGSLPRHATRQTDKQTCPGRSPHLEHQHAHVGHSQVDFGALAVRRKVKSDAVHLQFPSNFKHLEVGFSRSLTPIVRKKNK